MRTNLNVRYEERQVVKSLGARWDSARKVWYVENVENLERFFRWIPHSKPSAPSNQTKSIKSKGLLLSKGKTGKHYKKENCNCGLPPWDLCKENCEHRITNSNQQEAKDWLTDYAVKHDCLSSEVDYAPAELLTEQASHLRSIMDE
jgi:hypothetical protein